MPWTGWNAVDGVIHGACRAGEVKDVIRVAYVERLADIFLHKLESRVTAKMRQVRAAASQQVVDNNYAPAFAEQGVTEMRSQETGATGDESALLTHAFFAPFFKMLPAGTPSGWEAARPTL